ncbi:MAG TPA: DUF1501 domain-containing protein [Anaeromyxobacteraceae bacterium]|nr:DUF1501 domain-containing protein [Anaeromyxobacteraceae bacterium]
MPITRRTFLQGLGATGVVAAASGCSLKSTLGAWEPPIPIPAHPVLVIVDINGGWDWLNVLTPTAASNHAAYLANRATLNIPSSQVTTVNGDAGLNKDLIGMGDLSARGRVAWIPGIGMNNPDLSHFVSIALWGQGSSQPDGTGWLGRFADTAFNATGDVLRGITVTGDLPEMLHGATRDFVSITSASGYVYPSWLRSNRIGSPYDPQLLENGFGAAVTPTTTDPAQLAAARSGKLFLDAENQFGTNGTLPGRTPTVPYPGDADYPVTSADGGRLSSELSYQFKLIAQMLAAGLPTQIFFTRLSGWDTHSNEARDLPNLQRALGGSIKALYDDLAKIDTPLGNAQDRLMVVGYSEFGRRVPENQGGTDHGTAGLAFAVGRAVAGGVYGSYPDLNDLDQNRNMKYTTDFRSLYATVLDRWLGQSAATTNAILGTSYPRLGFI